MCYVLNRELAAEKEAFIVCGDTEWILVPTL